MSGGIYSTYEIRVRAVRAAIEERLPVTMVAQAYGTDRSTVHRWISRYEIAKGEEGLLRKLVPGRPRKLEGLDREMPREMILSPASVYGYETDFWTTLRLRRVIESAYGVVLSRPTIWRRLHEAGLTYQKPEREYFELSEEEREQWRRTQLPKIPATVRKYRAILYFQDEANISLTALLAQMMRHHKHRHLVIVMDQAPPHTSRKTEAFINSQRRLHVFHLPQYSPDWNPDEKLWNHLKHQELKGHQARTKAQLKQLTHDKPSTLSRNPCLLRGIFFRCCVAELMK